MQQPSHYFSNRIISGLAVFLLAGCLQPTVDIQSPAPGTAASLSGPLSATAPADAPPGTCWHQSSTPAVVETVTRRVLVRPADVSSDGTIRAPARYRNEDSQRIITPRRISWVELVCPDEFTEEFTASVQRALQARGYHEGTVTGTLDAVTSDAIRRYQQDQAITAPQLSVAAARKLGLRIISS